MKLTTLQDILGYQFSDIKLLERALTHSSLKQGTNLQSYNQRLEFLGDAVIDLIVAEYLFTKYKDKAEGELTQMRSHLVSKEALSYLGRCLKLGEYVRMSSSAERSGDRDRDSTLTDTVEAILGAIYVDAGLEASSKAWHSILKEYPIDERFSVSDESNSKGVLQETLQEIRAESPKYKTLNITGPDHDRIFTIEVNWCNQPLGQGTGNSKKAAEKAAAKDALSRRLWEFPDFLIP